MTNSFVQQLLAVLPSEQAEYLTAVDRKHFFRRTAIGSRFLKTKNLVELLALAFEQRGSLLGDDRQRFLQAGVADTALLPNCRYLWIETKGTIGIIPSTELRPGEQIIALRTKPGAPCSLVVERKELPLTTIGTVVIGENEAPQKTTPEMIWTAHPGLPIKPATADRFTDGQVLSLQDIQPDPLKVFYLNVRQI